MRSPDLSKLFQLHGWFRGGKNARRKRRTSFQGSGWFLLGRSRPLETRNKLLYRHLLTLMTSTYGRASNADNRCRMKYCAGTVRGRKSFIFSTSIGNGWYSGGIELFASFRFTYFIETSGSITMINGPWHPVTLSLLANRKKLMSAISDIFVIDENAIVRIQADYEWMWMFTPEYW